MKKRILFVDDETAVLQGLKRSLRGQRDVWDMAFVDSAGQAVELLEREEFDALVTDMRMPEMDGAQLLAHVAEHNPGVVRIVLSGHSDNEMNVKAAGTAHQYLNKPCDVKVLKQALERAFNLAEFLGVGQLCRFVNGLKHVPSPPRVYQQLVAAIESDNCSVKEIGEIIAADSAMTVKLLQLVNSGFFGLGRRVTDCADAAALIGMDTLKTLVLSVGIFAQYSAVRGTKDAFCTEALLSEGLAVGRVAREIAVDQGSEQKVADECFLAGMLHDLGILLLQQNCPEYYTELKRAVIEGGVDWSEAEQELFGTTHAAMGAYLLGLWGLPYSVVEAVAFHHQPSTSGFVDFGPLAAVHIADAAVHLHKEEVIEETGYIDEAYVERLALSRNFDDLQSFLFKEANT